MRILHVSELFYSLQGEGPSAGVPAVFLRLKGCDFDCGWCLGGNSWVSTRRLGWSKLSDARVGDEIWSFNEKTGVQEFTKVTKVMTREVDEFYAVRFDSKDVRTRRLLATAEHPFWIIGKGWTPASEIKAGDVVMETDSSKLKSAQKVGKSFHTDSSRAAISKRMQKHNPMFSPETAARVTATRKKNGFVPPLAALWKTKKFRDLVSKRMREDNPMFDPAVSAKSANRPYGKESKLEKTVSALISHFKLPIERNKGKLNLGRRIPDYVVEGKKKVIEVTHPTFYNREKEGYHEKNRKHYARFGYDCLTLYLRDFKLPTLRNVAGRLIEYAYNGVKVKSVRKFSRPLKVYNLTTENHTFFAGRVLSHNCDTTEVWKKGEPHNTDVLVNQFDLDGHTDALLRGASLVITGGNPLLQQGALVEFLMTMCLRLGVSPVNIPFLVEVETQGSRLPIPSLEAYVSQWNVSPKLVNSGVSQDRRIVPEVMGFHAKSPLSWFKFPVASWEDVEEVTQTFVLPFLIPTSRVMLMPICSSRKRHSDLSLEVAEWCKKTGYSYSPRLQLVLWDKTTGV